MASANDQYLPDLAKCFAGEAVVFSWTTIFQILDEDETDTESHQFDTLISSARVKSLLQPSVPNFSKPSPQSKTIFETKTAAINVTPSLDQTYDIDEIKSDTIWLSKEIALAEDEALRVVILEWQQRPANRLFAGYSDAELASLRNAYGNHSFDSIQGSESLSVRRNDIEFETSQSRRTRILNTFLHELQGLFLVSRRLQTFVSSQLEEPSIDEKLKRFSVETQDGKFNNGGVENIIEAVDSLLRSLERERDWSSDVPDANDRWIATGLLRVLTLQEMMLARIRTSTEQLPSATVVKWVQLVAEYDFFATIQPGPLLTPTQIEALQAMASVTTLAILDPLAATCALSEPAASLKPTTYFLNSDAAQDLHRILFTVAESCVAQASPVVLSWAIILSELKNHATAAKEMRESGAVQKAIDSIPVYEPSGGRRLSSGSFQQSIYEEVMQSIINTSDIGDPASYLLRCVTELNNVYDMVNFLASGRHYRCRHLHNAGLQLLQELLVITTSSLGYSSDILSSQFVILSSDKARQSSRLNTRESFIKNDFMMDHIFAVAAARFPYESLPFIRLCHLLSEAPVHDNRGTQYIMFRLSELDSYTQIAIDNFSHYHTVREDENLILVALDGMADMLGGRQRQLLSNNHQTLPMNLIPLNTLGEVISESQPPIIRWQHSYSGIAILGSWLELHYFGQLQSILSPSEAAPDVVTEVIGIVNGLLKCTITDPSTNSTMDDLKRIQNDILGEFSSLLQGDLNIADYIFQILEQEMQSYRRKPSNIYNTSVLVACIEFAAVYCSVDPDQFWPLFSKSNLLDSYGSDSLLLSIISGAEAPSQQFPLLVSCANVYHKLTKAVLEKPRSTTFGTKTTMTWKQQLQNSRLQANVLLSLTQSMYTAFEMIPGWTFEAEQEQNQIVTTLATAFRQIIVCANAIEHSESGITNAFVPASEFLARHLRFGADDDSKVASIIQHMCRIEETLVAVFSRPEKHVDEASEGIVALSSVLLKLGKLQQESLSDLDRQLFDITPVLLRNLTRRPRRTILDLVSNLLDFVGAVSPSSLLGHLGPTSAISALEILKLGLCDWHSASIKPIIWKILSQLAGRNQQWLAVLILTGSPPERALHDGKSQSLKTLRGLSFMELALSRLLRIAELGFKETISVLKFVIEAQVNWSWANDAVNSNRDFLPAILSYVCNTYADTGDELRLSFRNCITTSVTDLATIHLHHAKASRDTRTLAAIIPLLRWLSGNAIEVASYNHSLHSNLRKNFANKFSGLQLNDFKRTGLLRAEYGNEYYYDLAFADIVLKSDQQWKRSDRLQDQSFSAEFRRANLNLSLADSEVKLLSSLLNLCAEHSGYLAQDATAQPIIVDIVKASLNANALPCPLEKLYDDVLQTRADIAISLLQRLVDVKARGVGVSSLLKCAWECARLNNGSFEQAMIDNTLVYWRSMLTVILLTLQFQVDKKYIPPAADASPAALLRHTEQAIPTILEIITVVVARGFHSVSAALQDQRLPNPKNEEVSLNAVSHRDIWHILTIFDTILKMQRLSEFISEASQRLIVDGAIQSCLTLFSWSHTLTEPEFDNEPVYAIYSIQFLASMSSLPAVSEELAVEGVLSRLLSARMIQHLQSIPDGAGHIDTRPNAQTLYNLWAGGVAPLCLNLLHSVGAPVASEVSIFLNQFPNQLDRASVAFIPSQSRSRNPGLITSTLASEATTLSLISYILTSYRNAGASAAVDPSTVEALKGYDEHKKALSDDISDVVNTNPSTLKDQVVAINAKESVLVREGDGLVMKIVAELRNALVCLKGHDLEEDK